MTFKNLNLIIIKKIRICHPKNSKKIHHNVESYEGAASDIDITSLLKTLIH